MSPVDGDIGPEGRAALPRRRGTAEHPVGARAAAPGDAPTGPWTECALPAAPDPAGPDPDTENRRFRVRFSATAPAPDERAVLHFEGLTAPSTVLLNGVPLGTCTSTFVSCAFDATHALAADNELEIVCPSLASSPAAEGPRARWRTRLVTERRLRDVRATMVGRAPGFSPGPPVVGPFGHVLLRRTRGWDVGAWRRTVARDPDGTGVVRVSGRLEPIGGQGLPPDVTLELDRDDRAVRATAAVAPDGTFDVEVRIAAPALWWPHTHGEVALYDATLHVDGDVIVDAPVGFRTLAPQDPESPTLRINGVDVFARGAVWATSVPRRGALETRRRLELLRDAGLNVVRVVGTSLYEDEAFHTACDALGLLVWQDVMLANLDYPVDDPAWRAAFAAETTAALSAIGRHASTAVVCAGSEVAQQAAMFGREVDVTTEPLAAELIAGIAARECPNAWYVPGSPSGGWPPFRPDRGVAHYFGVGGYRRDLGDARRTGVRFASECLAFAHVPEEASLRDLRGADGRPARPGDATWKAATPRDNGADWDFEDVRDHYLSAFFDADDAGLRARGEEIYLDASRAVSGEVTAATLGEWRRKASPCGGAIILQACDDRLGAGWGLIDAHGVPKPAYWWVRRACGPLAVWMTDEGMSGVDVHVANDGAEPYDGVLAVRLVTDAGRVVEAAEEAVSVPARGVHTRGVEEIIGRFVDAAYSYRFGPPAHDVIAAVFRAADGRVMEALHRRVPWAAPGPSPQAAALTARVVDDAADARTLEVEAEVPVWGVRAEAPGARADDAWFCVIPGAARRVTLHHDGAAPTDVVLRTPWGALTVAL